MPVFACAMLAACSTAPPIGSNEPPDALDRVRAIDLQARLPEVTGTTNTGSGGLSPQVYYGSSGTQVTVDVDANAPNPGGGGEGVTLNFEDTPVAAVAKVILGDYLGAGYVIDPRVQGTISLSSVRPVPKSQLLFILESALRTTNAVLVHDAAGYRIVPADDAIGSGGVDRADTHHTPEPGYGVSVVPLQHVSVQTITKLLESFATKPGSIRADSSKNLMLVIGNGTERRTAVDTILSFDEDWMRGQSVGIFPVHNSTPEPLVAELERILDSGEDGLSQHMVKLQLISRMNAVLVVARKPELVRAAEKWINRLDAFGGGEHRRQGLQGPYRRLPPDREAPHRFVHWRRRRKHSGVGHQPDRARRWGHIFVRTRGCARGNPDLGVRAPRAVAEVWAEAGVLAVAAVRVVAGIRRGRRSRRCRRAGVNGAVGSAPGGAGQSQGQGGPFGALSAGAAGQGAGAGGADTAGPGGTGGGGVRAADAPFCQASGFCRMFRTTRSLSMPMRRAYRIIERALNQLDRPIAQVAIDVTIAEVHLNNDL